MSKAQEVFIVAVRLWDDGGSKLFEFDRADDRAGFIADIETHYPEATWATAEAKPGEARTGHLWRLGE